MKLPRQKPPNRRLRLMYRWYGLPIWGSQESRIRRFLDYSWIYGRLAHEESWKLYPYDKHPFRQAHLKFVSRHLTENDVVLDLGCGIAVNAELIAPIVKEVVGVDHQKRSLDIARARFSAPNVTLQEGDAKAFLEASEKEFTVLYMSHILEHLDNPGDYLRDYQPYFKYIYVEVPDLEESWLNQYRMDFKASLNYTDDDHVAEFDRRELLALFAEHNLTVLDAEYRFGLQYYWLQVPES